MKLYNDSRDLDINDPPSEDQLEYWIYDGVAEATDGCDVEPDGECEHGHQSWVDVIVVEGRCEPGPPDRDIDEERQEAADDAAWERYRDERFGL